MSSANPPNRDPLYLHQFFKGKVQVMPKCAIRDSSDFSVWYTPGVAAPCKAIQHEPDLVYEHTNKGNTIAIVSDGTRVLGLGDIGPEAGLPVMEGKSLLFKYLGGVDAISICLATKDPDEIIATVKLLEPSFGGINLEDICQPKCFRILDALRAEMKIPVWHDDQQGSATVALAGCVNALQVVGKDITNIKIAMVGMGAANVATYRLLKTSGVDPAQIVACDSKGTLHSRRSDIERVQQNFPDKWRVCVETNPAKVTGGIAEALQGADMCIAFSCPGPDVIKGKWIEAMNENAIVFACANPVPEIWPAAAKAAGAKIVATGRGDFPNQLNNSLVFPGMFRGVLDVRARTITDEMAIAVADALAQYAQERQIHEDDILPRMEEWKAHAQTAVAAAKTAQQQGVARLSASEATLYSQAVKTIRAARDATQMLIREGFIPKPPEV
ncbi:MAG: NADP-dependent malic enzyme [Gammaproteobacteria bacterium]|nr:NADP-dependent malic enzyme [Gammaproteobacteria bacterium]